MRNLEIGMEASIIKAFTEKDVQAFASLSTDTNPIHLDHSYAVNTIFKNQIVHGYLYGSLLSAVIGTKLPGPGSIYIHQEMNFKKPVYFNEEVTAVVKIIRINPEKSLIYLSTNCFKNTDEMVIEGSAIIKLI
jgi:3-hydroxybutyryl-CoA dehydratase